MLRRYEFKLYPTRAQAQALDEQRRMVADLWNALLERHEEIIRRTRQRQTWIDRDGNRHIGQSLHSPTWETIRKKSGERVIIEPGDNGQPKPYSRYDMQNEITWMLQELPEWRTLSVWIGHRTAAALDNAFQAFYRRLNELKGDAYETKAAEYLRRHPVHRDGTPTRKPTRFQLAGYPRFKRRDRHASIPHRFVSGCQLNKDPRHNLSWLLRLKGIDGDIHARGKFPSPNLMPHRDQSGPVEDWTYADVVWRNQRWWISVAVDVPPRRHSGGTTMVIELDLLDEFARVNGYPETPPNFARLESLEGIRSEMQEIHDQRWPHRRIPETERIECEESRKKISGLHAFIARARRDSLHVWSARIISRASDITIIMPDLRKEVRTPRGNERNWGAQVGTVSELNRHILGLAAGSVVQMLQYKAEEAGIRCDVVKEQAPKIAVGGDLVGVGQEVRRIRRRIKQMENTA